MSRVVIVTGSRLWPREFEHRHVIESALSKCAPSHVIHGGAAGADTDAAFWARMHGVAVTGVPYFGHKGKAGGHARNAVLIEIGLAYRHAGADVRVLAFPTAESRGTWDCVRRAVKAGLPWQAWGPDGVEIREVPQ